MNYFEISGLILILLLILILKVINRDDIIKTNPKLNIKGYKLFYTDGDYEPENKNIIRRKILKSQKYKVQGKPDFVFKSKIQEKYIVVELKSGTVKDSKVPKPGDLMQLVTYFIIIEELYKRPKKGHLIYKDYMFIIKNTRKLRKQFKSVLKDMDRMLISGKGNCNPSFAKCRHCICNGTVCKQNK